MSSQLINRMNASFRTRTRKFWMKNLSESRKSKIKHHDFTIISDNCWGGLVYQSFGLRYNTPTIGLYIYSDDYIKMLKNLRYYMSVDLKFIKPKETKHYDSMSKKSNFGSFPIGKLDDIEIMFLHYSSEEEAYEKWTKRAERINWDKLIIKFNDQVEFNVSHVQEFEKLDYKNKFFFSSKPHPGIKSEIFIREAKGQESIKIYQEPIIRKKYIDLISIINNL